MGTLELFAVIIAALIIIKITVVLINPHAWFKYVVKPIYGNPVIWGLIFLGLFIWTGSHVLAQYTIVEVMAMLLPLTFLIALGALPFSKTLLHWYEEIVTPGMVRKAWLPILLWSALSVWAFYVIFF